jgi:hypothetical protein
MRVVLQDRQELVVLKKNGVVGASYSEEGTRRVGRGGAIPGLTDGGKGAGDELPWRKASKACWTVAPDGSEGAAAGGVKPQPRRQGIARRRRGRSKNREGKLWPPGAGGNGPLAQQF